LSQNSWTNSAQQRTHYENSKAHRPNPNTVKDKAENTSGTYETPFNLFFHGASYFKGKAVPVTGREGP
jgi:hypothetical protein